MNTVANKWYKVVGAKNVSHTKAAAETHVGYYKALSFIGKKKRINRITPVNTNLSKPEYQTVSIDVHISR